MSMAGFKTRTEMKKLNTQHEIQANIASVALAIEALEQLLIERHLLKRDELMERCTELAKQKIRGNIDAEMARREPIDD